MTFTEILTEVCKDCDCDLTGMWEDGEGAAVLHYFEDSKERLKKEIGDIFDIDIPEEKENA